MATGAFHIYTSLYIIDCFGLLEHPLFLFSHTFILGICKPLIALCLFLLFNLISIMCSSGGIVSMLQGCTLVVWRQFRKANACNTPVAIASE